VNFLRRVAFQEKKLNDSSRLDVVEIARVPDMLPSMFPSWSGYGLISTPVKKLHVSIPEESSLGISYKTFKDTWKSKHVALYGTILQTQLCLSDVLCFLLLREHCNTS